MKIKKLGNKTETMFFDAYLLMTMCNKENKASIWRRKKKKNGDELKETYQIKNGEEEEWQWSGLRILVDVSTWMVKKKQDDGVKNWNWRRWRREEKWRTRTEAAASKNDEIGTR